MIHKCEKCARYSKNDICKYCNSKNTHEATEKEMHLEFSMSELMDYFGKDEVIDFLNEGY